MELGSNRFGAYDVELDSDDVLVLQDGPIVAIAVLQDLHQVSRFPRPHTADTWKTVVLAEDIDEVFDFETGSRVIGTQFVDVTNSLASDNVHRISRSKGARMVEAIHAVVITDPSDAGDLARIEELPNVEVVNWPKPVSDAEALLLNKVGITTLYLHCARLNDTDLIPLYTIERLTDLLLPMTGMSNEAVQRLSEARPSLTIGRLECD